MTGSGSTTSRTACSSPRARPRASGSGTTTRSSTSRPCGLSWTTPPSTPSWRSGPTLGPDPGTDHRAGRVRSTAGVPARRGVAAAALRRRRLRRLLRLARPRHQRRPDLPARPGTPAAELEAPSRRLPRTQRVRRRQRYAGRAAVRPAEGTDGGLSDVRAQPAPGHRGRARLRGRRRVGARQPDPGRGALAARLRRGRPERLERPRHPGLGVRAARTVPGQVLRHVGECLGDSRWRPWPTRAPSSRLRSPLRSPTSPAATRSTSPSRSCSTARW